ncbi:MAG: hypothetical protein HY654_02870 [Acidobacteria bacterium]|nr:hypothetical protein [Acidobacteriota bacterium]
MRTAAGLLVGAVIGLAWLLAGNRGPLYLLLYTLATVPGWPLGFALFGRRHAAGWVAGALLGYAFTALAWWGAIQLDLTSFAGFTLVWAAITAAVWLTLRTPATGLIALPAWTRRDGVGLFFVLLLVPAIAGPPFLKVGSRDASGARLYRAYFTADFLWHRALVAELRRFDFPPRDPYATPDRLNYYWTYFLVPAVISETFPGRVFDDTERILLLNALGAGVLFVASLFLAIWIAVPHAGPAAAATLLAVVAASAEGAYVLWDLWRRGTPLAAVRQLNIDAITLWFFQALTIDGLPRSLWYTPQHAAACGLGLVALTAALRGSSASGAVPFSSGVALAAAVTFSPFLGGVFSLIYGVTIVVRWLQRELGVTDLGWHAVAAAPVVLATAWCVANDMLSGAGGALRLGITPHAYRAIVVVPALALAPLLLAALAGCLPWRGIRLPATGVAGFLIAVPLLLFVSIGGTDPIWVGWRAGQVLLVTLPIFAARAFARLWQMKPPASVGVFAALLLTGAPTTVIDAYNAQDVSNRDRGPGFRWTVAITRAQQAAFAWVTRETPRNAVVQMEPTTRGRETWTLIPTFAERRMAAGLPISLVSKPAYETGSQRVRSLYGTADPDEACGIARRMRIDYLYVDTSDRALFGDRAMAKFDAGGDCFSRVFRNDEVSIFAVK